MKIFCSLLLAAALAPAASAVSLTIDSVRQRWPFSSKVDIAFTVSGADGDFYTLKDFKVFDGAREVDHPGTCAFENVRAAYGNGSYVITYDPARSLLTNVVAVQRFRVSFDITQKPVRYLVLDLAKGAGAPGAVEYVYEGDERLETFTRTLDYLDLDGETARQATISYDNAFLSLTNATFNLKDQYTQQMASPYLVTKMAFRLVASGAYRVGKGAIGASGGNAVTFTKPYFISVFPLTAGQYGMLRFGDWKIKSDGSTIAWGNRPEQTLAWSCYFDEMRGARGDAAHPVDWIRYGHAVAPDSLFGLMRAKYGFSFDLATEAQWEVACRAGTTGWYYVNEEVTGPATNLFARLGNTPVGNSNSPLGTHAANAWGLFDMLGGKGEVVLDNAQPDNGKYNWYNDGAWPSGTDPVGVETYTGLCLVRGGGSAGSVPVACGMRSGAAKESTRTRDWGDPYYQAIRLVIDAD